MMDATRFEQVQAVFAEALERPDEERAAFLDAMCGADAGLRAEVESLLCHHGLAEGRFLKAPAGEDDNGRSGGTFWAEWDDRALSSSATEKHGQGAHPGAKAGEPPDQLIGRSVGAYSVVSVLAVGGMGTVYLAEQATPRRQVALKVMHMGLGHSSAQRRFEYESQVLGKLRHHNIAHVYEAGTHRDGASGREYPYFAMEYVPQACPITEYADREGLDTRQRVTLFIQVCDAVHHGHQKGVIHRDLKPSNILVDAAGQVKVIDFGVALSTDSDVAVTTVQADVRPLIGTLQYMSPEQCDADPHNIDTRSDVYALGAVLYELLCGRRPYAVDGTTLYEAVRVIREHTPARLSSINRRLRGDLETIALKALEKDRDRRYASAAELGQDLRRWLTGEPIAARPPDAWRRAYLWVGRHPALATGAVCILIAAAILAGTWAAVWLARDRPYALVRVRTEEVRLVSYAGNTLETWTSQLANGRIACASGLVPRPEEMGGGRLALIGFCREALSEHAGTLVAYNVDEDYRTPEWIARIEAGDPMPDPYGRGYDEVMWNPNEVWAADVFAESPGSEVIVAFVCLPFSQVIVRVYDARGQVLYEFWHDGLLHSCYWMAGHGLLAFAGANDQRRWPELGHPEWDYVPPRVVFALKPRMNTSVKRILPTRPGDGPDSPAWYFILIPYEPPCFGIELVVPWRLRPDQGVAVNLMINPELDAGFSWDLDAMGREVPGSRIRTDVYIEHEHKLPDHTQYKLVPYDSVLDAVGG